MGADPLLRTDARRNRDAIIKAARSLFAERGLEVPIDEIARGAGVGSATLYRRFPTREALVEAVFEERMGEQIDAAERALEVDDPWDALVGYVRETCRMQAGDRGLADILALEPSSPILAELTTRGVELTETLMRRAHSAGVVRSELQVEDFPLLLMANAGIVDRAGESAPAASERFVAVALEGWRVTATAPLPPAPSREAIVAAIPNSPRPARS